MLKSNRLIPNSISARDIRVGASDWSRHWSKNWREIDCAMYDVTKPMYMCHTFHGLWPCTCAECHAACNSLQSLLHSCIRSLIKGGGGQQKNPPKTVRIMNNKIHLSTVLKTNYWYAKIILVSIFVGKSFFFWNPDECFRQKKPTYNKLLYLQESIHNDIREVRKFSISKNLEIHISSQFSFDFRIHPTGWKFTERVFISN